MPKRQSLYDQYPDYRVDMEPNAERVRVSYNGAVIADSDRTVLVRETKHHPVIYFPREDVHFEHLESTKHESFCPFKGEASYWTLRVGDQTEENGVWSYEDPFDEVAGLAGYLAFYEDRVEWSS